MSAADRLEDGFPHGTVDGYLQGCKGGWCPEGNAHGLSCKRAKQLNAGDYRYQRLVKLGHTLAQIADELGLAPETHQTPTPAPKPEPVQEEPVMAFETFTKPEPTQKPQPHGYAAVRAWARENGIHVNAQGRVPRAVMDAYDAAHAQEPADAPEPVAAPVEPQEPETPVHEAGEAGEDAPALDGATGIPKEGMRIGTPGEFAAIWNSRNDAQRAYMLEVIRYAQEDQMRCVLEDHAGKHDHLDRVARAHHAAVNRAEVAEDALALALQKWGKARDDLADARRLIHALSTEVVTRRQETAEAESKLANLTLTQTADSEPVEQANQIAKVLRWNRGVA